MWLLLAFLAVFCFSAVNVVNSVVVHHFEKHPMVLGWHQGTLSVAAMLVFALFVDVRSSWAVALLAGGAVAYVGDLAYYRVLRSVDASVMNIGSSILAVMLVGIGLAFFGEQWSMLQLAGALLVMAGVVVLSLDRGTFDAKSLFLLALMALFYVPFYAVLEAALLDGQSLFPVYVLPIIGRDTLAFAAGLLQPSIRRRIIDALPHRPIQFHLLNILVIAFFLAGTLFLTLAYEYGPLSLTAIIINAQPFVMIPLAWVCGLFFPLFAPRELLTTRSIFVKIISFLIVFVGLAALAAAG